MRTLLFQGDSITDCGRQLATSCGFPQHGLGPGYAGMVAARLAVDRPGEWTVLNRGVSGNRIVDLYARWKMDALNLKPDVLSILIGINDVGHELVLRNGVEADRYVRVYGEILDWTKAVLPCVKLIVLEPFSFPQNRPEMAGLEAELASRIPALKELAAARGALYVPLQKRFNDAIAAQGVDYWTCDRLHPNLAGQQLIADAFLKEAAGLLA